jgi:hypothetical protein
MNPLFEGPSYSTVQHSKDVFKNTDELLKAVLSLRENPQEEKVKTLSLIEEWISTHKDSSKIIFSKTKQTIREELHKALREKPCSQLDFIKKAYHLLMAMEPAQSFHLLKELGNFYLHRKMNDLCIQVLKEMSPKLTPSLQKKVSGLNSSSAPKKTASIFKAALHTKERLPVSPQAEKGLQYLENILAKDKKPTDPDPDTTHALQTLLLEAFDNAKLNKVLYRKKNKTVAEEFLCTFSYKSLKATEARKAVSKFTALTGEKTCVRKYLNAYQETCSKANLAKKYLKILLDEYAKPLGVEKEMQEAINLLPKSNPGSFWIKNSQEILSLLKEKLSKITPKTGSDEDRNVFSIGIQSDIQHIENYSDSLKALNTLIPELEKEATHNADRLARDEIKALEAFADLEKMFSKIEKKSGVKDLFLESPLEDIKALVSRSSSCIDDSTTLVQTLHPAVPGDVLFDQEDLSVKKGAVVWSKLRTETSLPFTALPSLLKNLLRAPRGVFAIQGFIFGNKIHVSMVSDKKNQTGVCEIFDTFYNLPMKLTNAMKSIAYTSQFLARLTPEGKTAIHALWPDHSDDWIEHKIVQIHADIFQKHLEEKSNEFENITNPGVMAIDKFVKNFINSGRWPWLTKPLRMLLLGLPWKVLKKIYLHVKPEPALAAPGKKFMMCSEFSVMVLTDVQAKMEDELRKQMLSAHVTPSGPLFSSLTPPSTSSSFIHSNKLEQIFCENGFYKRRDPSLCLRLLLDDPGKWQPWFGTVKEKARQTDT